MFNENGNEVIRREKIKLSDFTKENLHVAIEVGQFKTKESHIARIEAMEEEVYLVLYFIEGSGILVENEYTALETKSTLIRLCNQDFSIYLDQCEVYYALLQGNHIKEFLKEEIFLLDLCFSKKTEIFFYSLISSLDKYKMVDEFSISASVLRFYSDFTNYLKGFRELSGKQEIVEKALSFIEANYQAEISLSDISEASGYSEYYFLRIFKEVMRMTPYDYLIRRRLSQVKLLLLNSEKTIEEIALECGFKSDISLYKTFKNIYKITPREFKKMK